MKSLKFLKSIIIVALASLIIFGCTESTLDVLPRGVVTEEDLTSPENAEKIVIAAYAAQANDNVFSPWQDMWETGSVGGGDAHKGGGCIGDQIGGHWVEIKSLNRSAGNPRNDLMWKYMYGAIGRANEALGRLNVLTDADLSTRSVRIAEMHFLRAYTYFKLKVSYKNIVYIDENIPKGEYKDLSNRAVSDQDGWTWIIDDFRRAVSGLPTTQADEGRPTKNAAQLFLAKSLIFKAFVQNDNHQVASITTSELQEAIGLFEAVEATGEYDLWSDISANYECATESGIESVWAIIRSIEDGTTEGRLNMGSALNSPSAVGYGCCGFFTPSGNLINAHKTDADGLPLFDTFNEAPIIETSVDVEANNMDPRFSHGIAIIGMPWKYDPNRIFDNTYARCPSTYGPNMQFKDQLQPDDPCWRQAAAFYGSSRNTDAMRYADALLYWAEALVEVGRQMEAMPIINRIRERAANSTALLVKADGSPSGQYVIGQYDASHFADQAQAREIVRWERRLEMALESHPGRHFDLVRWGIAADWMNNYFEVEKTRRSYMVEALFTAGRDEYYPIPAIEIIISQGLIQQNPGYN
jgi:hypothetical protein